MRGQGRVGDGAGATAASIPAMIRAIVILVFLVGGLHAEVLRFEQRTIELKPAADATTIQALYRFTNTSDRVVTITSTQSSCGCVVAELVRTVYQPGEAGEIPALFTVGDAGGRQEKTIDVSTDHPDETAIRLTLAVELPLLPVPQPGVVTWKKDGALEPRQVFIAIPAGSTMRFAEARPSQKTIAAVLSEAPGGSAWLLTLTPTDTSKPVNVMVEVDSNGPRKIYIFASVVE